jgi:translation initiation factor 1
MAKKKQPPVEAHPVAWPSLADALRARGLSVGADQGEPDAAPPATNVGKGDAADLSRSGKIVVRHERKGHGGKTVTIVEGLKLPAAQLELMARTLRKAFGCGARVDDGRVVLQGDLTTAVAGWLRGRGAARVTLGN